MTTGASTLPLAWASAGSRWVSERMSSRVCASGTGGAGVGSAAVVAAAADVVEVAAWRVAAAPWRCRATFCSSSAAMTARMTAMTTRTITVVRLLLDCAGVGEGG